MVEMASVVAMWCAMFLLLFVMLGSSHVGDGLAAFFEALLMGLGVQFWVDFPNCGFVLLPEPSLLGFLVALRMLIETLVVGFVVCRHRCLIPP